MNALINELFPIRSEKYFTFNVEGDVYNITRTERYLLGVFYMVFDFVKVEDRTYRKFRIKMDFNLM